jgi:hypothetical protein
MCGGYAESLLFCAMSGTNVLSTYQQSQSHNNRQTILVGCSFESYLVLPLRCCIQVSGQNIGSVASAYGELKVEWDNLLGWCCDKAFSSQGEGGSSMYEEQLNLFYVLVQ